MVDLGISRTAAFVKIHDAFTPDEQARYFAPDIQENVRHYDPKQAAFGIWSLFWLAPNASLERRVAMMDQASSLDPSNAVYTFAKAAILFDAGNDKEADVVLASAVADGWLDKSL